MEGHTLFRGVVLVTSHVNRKNLLVGGDIVSRAPSCCSSWAVVGLVVWPGAIYTAGFGCAFGCALLRSPRRFLRGRRTGGRGMDGGKEGSGMDCLLSRPPSFSSHPSHRCAFQLFTPAEYAPSSPSLDLALAQSSDGRNSASERKRWSPGLHCLSPFPLSPTNLKLFLSRRDGQVPVRLWP